MRYIFPFVFCLAFLNNHAQTRNLLAGTYDSPKSEGIYVLRFDPISANLSEVSHIRSSNPSFLAVSRDGRFVFAVNENAAGTVRSFSLRQGELKFLDTARSGGAHPCHIAVDHTGKWLLVANYSSGSMGVLSVSAEGTIRLTDSVQHYGAGADPARQKGPHAHGVYFSADNRKLFVTDLGNDNLYTYPFNPENGTLGPPDSLKLPPGSGPRSFCFHPNGKSAYLIEELSGSIETLHWQGGKPVSIQRISNIAKGDSGRAGSGHIAISGNGRFVYASNRYEMNNIMIYKTDPFTDELKWVGQFRGEGKTPRHFSIDPSGRYLLCAYQNSDWIAVYRIQKKTGKLKDTGKRLSLGKPVCLQWLP